MRLLLFSDLHCDVDSARKLVNYSRTVDVVVGAGDYANVRRNIHACLDILRGIEKPMVLVPGNNESLEELVEACRSWPQTYVLHGSSITIHGIVFFGLGGGVPVTPFGAWSYDFSEKEAAELLADCPAACVLVSHSPPKGAVDKSSSGRSLGSIAVRETILQTQPRLVVCGHIHSSGGQQGAIGPTPIVNAGPGGVEWNLDVPV